MQAVVVGMQMETSIQMVIGIQKTIVIKMAAGIQTIVGIKMIAGGLACRLVESLVRRI